MKLICYPTFGEPPAIRPAPASRTWMDATPESFAYRCLPLLIANSHGWEILSPCAFTAVWTGGVEREAVQVVTDTPAHKVLAPSGHFGSGVLTFQTKALFRTQPGVNLWATGPVNQPKDGIAPLSGVIETDWAPYPFTMNWLFTRPNHPVRFEEGEPFCFFFPLMRDTVEATDPEIRDLNTNPELKAEHRLWFKDRAYFSHDFLNVPDSAARKAKWTKLYYRGLRADGTAGPPSHQAKLRLRPFENLCIKPEASDAREDFIELSIDEALRLAVVHHRAGRLELAEHIYGQILAAEPDHADAQYGLDRVLRKLGQVDEA
jgi:hypothetical protein